MTRTLDEILDEARAALNRGATQEVLELLEQSGAESMLHPDFWYLRGVSLYGLSRFEESAESFETLCELVPAHSEPRAFAADAYVRCQRFETAEKQLLSGLELDPESILLLQVYCYACARVGQTEKARLLLDRIHELEPRNEAAFQLKILIEFVEGRDAGFLEALQHQLSGLPESAEKSLQMGHALLESGRIRGATRWLKQALAQDPKLLETYPALDSELRFLESPLLLPARVFDRYGQWRPWAVGVITMLFLQTIVPTAGLIFGACFVGLLIYSWIVPPLVYRVVCQNSAERIP
jgi:tetratricopeptide (TPR) repeat protein